MKQEKPIPIENIKIDKLSVSDILYISILSDFDYHNTFYLAYLEIILYGKCDKQKRTCSIPIDHWLRDKNLSISSMPIVKYLVENAQINIINSTSLEIGFPPIYYSEIEVKNIHRPKTLSFVVSYHPKMRLYGDDDVLGYQFSNILSFVRDLKGTDRLCAQISRTKDETKISLYSSYRESMIGDVISFTLFDCPIAVKRRKTQNLRLIDGIWMFEVFEMSASFDDIIQISFAQKILK